MDNLLSWCNTNKANTCSSCVVFLGSIIDGNIRYANDDNSELGLEPRWVDASDIINDVIPIRHNHAALKTILLKAVGVMLRLYPTQNLDLKEKLESIEE